MVHGRRMGRRENKIRFKRDSARVKSSAIPGKVFMRGGARF